MAGRAKFGAPWGRDLWMVSSLGMLTIGLPAIINLTLGRLVISALLLGILAAIISLTVRGYEVAPDELRIRRLFWITRWPLRRPTIARVQPYAMAGSWRLWGNGGFFAVSGTFSNALLGRYHAFATDARRTVVMDTPKGVLVVSPDAPEEFVVAIREITALS